MRCQAAKSNGDPCRNHAKSGHKYCASHIQSAKYHRVAEKNLISGESIPTIYAMGKNPSLRDALKACKNNHQSLRGAIVPQSMKGKYEKLQEEYSRLETQLQECSTNSSEWSSQRVQLEDLIQRHSELNSETTALQDQNRELLSKVASLQLKNKEQRESLEREISESKSSSYRVSEKMSACSQQVEDIRKRVEEERQNVLSCQTDYNVCTVDLENEKKRMITMTQEMNKVIKERNSAQKELDKTLRQLKKARDSYEIELRNASSLSQATESELQAEMVKISSRMSDYENIREQNQQLTDELKSQQKENQKLLKKISSTKVKYEQIEKKSLAQADKLQKQYEKLLDAKRNDEESIAKYEQKVQEYTSKMEKLLGKEQDLRETISSLEDKYKILNAELQNKMSRHREDMENLKRKHNDLKQKHLDHLTLYKELERNLEEKVIQSESIQSELDRTAKELREWKSASPDILNQISTTLMDAAVDCSRAGTEVDKIISKYFANTSIPSAKISQLRLSAKALCERSESQSRQIDQLSQKYDKDTSRLRGEAKSAISEAESAKIAVKDLTTQLNQVARDVKDVKQSDPTILADVLNVLESRTDSCGEMLDRVTAAVGPWKGMASLRPKLKKLVDQYCKTKGNVVKLQSKFAVEGPSTKSVGRVSLGRKKAAVKYSAEELMKIKEKALQSQGIVKAMVRVRCSSSPSESFYVGPDPENDKMNLLEVSTQNGGAIRLKREKTNLFIYNDNNHLEESNGACSAIGLATRNKEFYDQSIGSYLDVQVPITVLAYGQSGSGKTTTIDYILSRIFTVIGEQRISDAKVAFVDIYNNRAVDLLRHFTKNGGNSRDKKSVDAIVRRRMIREIFNPLLLQIRILDPSKTFEEIVEDVRSVDPNYKCNPSEDSISCQMVQTMEQLRDEMVEEMNTEKFVELYEEVYITHTARTDKELLYGSKGILRNDLKTKPSYHDVGSISNYQKIFKYARAIRPVSITPQNTGGSSRSHLIVQFDLGAGLTLSLIDLAGSEDYDYVLPRPYASKLRSAGVYVPKNEVDSVYKTVREESKNINESLTNLTKYIKSINEKRISGTSKTRYNEKDALVRVLTTMNALGHHGITTMVTTFKSSDDSDSLREAERTIRNLQDLVPSDEVLNQLS